MTAKQSRNMRPVQNQESSREMAQPAAKSGIHPMLGWQHSVGNAHIARMVAQQDAMLALAQPEVGHAGGAISNQLMSRIQTQRGRGNTLPQSQRGQMEQKFGVALDDVRIHTNAEADALNRNVSAKAFTIGRDIFFRQDASPSNSKLLAHELTHVVQQSTLSESGPMKVGPAGDSYEREADQTAAGSYDTSQINVGNQPTTMQRSIWGGDDLEGDFWGTRALLGDRWGGTLDAGMSSAWNLAGAIPGIGTGVSLASSAIDSGKSITSSIMGDRGAAEHFSNDSIASLASAIPIWGTGQGVLSGLWDAGVAIERSQGIDTAPTSSDIFDEMLEY